ncbi:DUF4128 domain-containing protein [Azospirillum canadense]|uniref:DUF4128 domain-containing protein n=1 Tax=Azospirillum canadense TaxID=403962 RepID=UPI002226B083|nr:DUF4128 domain-containing protein [Azospirillum canadense]MCW2242259.1 hypothetical protein [Azospirillum canadense]
MAAIDDGAVRAALEGVLQAAASALPPITGENVTFQPATNAPALRTRLFRHPKRRYAGFTALDGFLHIEVWTPANVEAGPAEAIAAQVEALFAPYAEADEAISGLVHVQDVAILTGGPDDTDAFWVVPVQVDWWVAQ